MKFRINDKVVVITGKDKGKVGEIMSINKAKNRIVVKGVNIITKHIRAAQGRPGQRIQTEASIDASNAMLVCPKTGKRTRIGYKKEKGGKKERYAKISNEALVSKSKKQ